MLFGYVPVPVDGKDEIKLSFLPSYPDIMSRALRVDILRVSKSAVYFLSPLEAVYASWDSEHQSLVVQAVPPSVIYLTPDSSDKPGIMARKLRIKQLEDGDVAVEYARKFDEPWMAWDPQERIR